MSDQTTYKLTTKHSYATPHKYPTGSNDSPADDNTGGVSGNTLKDLSIQLYPTGRAWYRNERGIWELLHESINRSFSEIIEDSFSLISGTLPDNSKFTESDASLWEYRLGLITNDSLDLEVRKTAIRRKLGHPNNVKARQHPSFMQYQLQLAGFNVWIHENTIPYRTPQDILISGAGSFQHGGISQHGAGSQHGGESFNVIANSIDEIESFGVGAEGLWATFFISGEILGSTAIVPKNRLREFKELVIKLKPAHTVAFTFINYI